VKKERSPYPPEINPDILAGSIVDPVFLFSTFLMYNYITKTLAKLKR